MLQRHAEKPGTPEHGTPPAEQRSTPEQWWNNLALSGTPAEHPRISTKYRSNTSGARPEQRNHTKSVQGNQLSSAPLLIQFQGVQKSNNPFKRTPWVNPF